MKKFNKQLLLFKDIFGKKVEADFQGGEVSSDAGLLFLREVESDVSLLGHIFTSRKIDCVMHFAAFSLVGESIEQPLSYYQNNTAGTTTLLIAMRDHGVDKFIFSSTTAVYGEPSRIPICEGDKLEPTNPYGRSKLFIEKIVENCRLGHWIDYTFLRYFNAAGADISGEIGEDHSPEAHLIPIVLQVALGQREYIEIYGTDWDTTDGTCIRDYVHVHPPISRRPIFSRRSDFLRVEKVKFITLVARQVIR